MLCDTGISEFYGFVTIGSSLRSEHNIARTDLIPPHSGRLHASLRLNPVSLRSTDPQSLDIYHNFHSVLDFPSPVEM